MRKTGQTSHFKAVSERKRKNFFCVAKRWTVCPSSKVTERSHVKLIKWSSLTKSMADIHKITDRWGPPEKVQPSPCISKSWFLGSN